MKNVTPTPTQKPHEKHIDVPVRQPPVTATVSVASKIEPLQLNTVHDTRRDEAVNTIDSTFRR